MRPFEGSSVRRHVLVFVALFALGCTGSRSFQPAEHATARSTSGRLAAEYDLRPPGGSDVGDVRVWSDGASSDSPSDATSWHVGFEIENEGEEPIVVDTAKLRIARVYYLGSEARGLGPVRTDGDVSVPPGSVGTVDVYFRLPGVDPSDIDGFQLAWTVVSGKHRWSELTPFIPQVRGRYYPPYYGPYGPYGPYWGPYYGPYYWPRPVYRRLPTRAPSRSDPYHPPAKR